MSKIDFIFVTYFVELWAYIFQNVSNNVQIKMNMSFFFKIKAHFNFSANVTKHNVSKTL